MNSSILNVYGFKDLILVPTTVMTDVGLYVHEEPVLVIRRDDYPSIKKIISGRLSAPNARVRHPSQEELSKPAAVLKHAKVKSWKAFESAVNAWRVTYDDSAFTLTRLVRMTPRGLTEDRTSDKRFTGSDARDAVVDALITDLASTQGSE
jgi:hypothetical protein